MKNKNQLSQNIDAETIITAEVTARVAGVSPSLVKAVRRGERNADKGAGKKAAIADDLLKTGVNALVREVERIVKFD